MSSLSQWNFTLRTTHFHRPSFIYIALDLVQIMCICIRCLVDYGLRELFSKRAVTLKSLENTPPASSAFTARTGSCCPTWSGICSILPQLYTTVPGHGHPNQRSRNWNHRGSWVWGQPGASGVVWIINASPRMVLSDEVMQLLQRTGH